MQLSDNDLVGPYQVLKLIGEGGMGRVYRARDTRLGRDVALKVSDGRFTDRFRIEARAVAALNHANICTLYDVGPNYLVMEIVDGPTLAERIAQGPMLLDEAIDIALQIAAALEAAHEKGIVHRDLKPGNIKITPDGNVKVLDFGLAKALQQEDSLAEPQNSDLWTAARTEAGVILGTAAYMAPEQARAQSVDKRVDIWAFGVVLYEMLTRRAPFRGDTSADTIAAVLTREPDWQSVPARAFPLLRRCLEKDPKRRLRDIGDARILLEEYTEAPASPLTSRASKLPWVAVAAVSAVLAVVLVLMFSRNADHQLIRVDVDLGENATASALAGVAITPDGSRLAFPVRTSDGRRMLGTRLLDQQKVTVLAGTEGATQPFFSPDSEWIGFFAGEKLQKVSVRGGTPVTLSKANIARGASWGDDGTIIAALNNSVGLSRISANGGEPDPVTKLDPDELTHRWPQVLPGASAVLFTAHTPTINSFENASIDVQLLATGERKTVWRGGYFGRFLPTRRSQGYLLYVQMGTIFAIPFDLNRLEVSGTPKPLAEDLGSDHESGAGAFDFSRTGIFVYRSGSETQSWTVDWLDNSGSVQPLLAKPALYYSPRFSPDGSRLAIGVDAGKGADIFVYNLEDNSTLKLNSSNANNADPVWTPDGKHIVFRGGTRSGDNVWWIRSDGSGAALPLLDKAEGHQVGDFGPNSFSPDGRWLIYSETSSLSSDDLWTLSLDLSDPDHPVSGKPEAFVRTPFKETRPGFSPDGRWVAYASTESGKQEIYVQPFPGALRGSTGKWQVSTGGGGLPIWSRNGRDLFYVTGKRIMVVEYTVKGDSFIAGKPRLWSETDIRQVGFTNLDLSPDGKRFAFFPQPKTMESNRERRATFLFNLFGDFGLRFPGERN